MMVRRVYFAEGMVVMVLLSALQYTSDIICFFFFFFFFFFPATVSVVDIRASGLLHTYWLSSDRPSNSWSSTCGDSSEAHTTASGRRRSSHGDEW
jgi:hypothetical protein